MTVELITEIEDFLDENYNPVEDEEDARYRVFTTFNKDGSIKDHTTEILLHEKNTESILPPVVPPEEMAEGDPVNNVWSPGKVNPDHEGDCCSGDANKLTLYENKGETLFKQAVPGFSRDEGDIGIGKEDPANTDRNIVLRTSQAFSDHQESHLVADASDVAEKGIEISKLWKEKDESEEEHYTTKPIELTVVLEEEEKPEENTEQALEMEKELENTETLNREAEIESSKLNNTWSEIKPDKRKEILLKAGISSAVASKFAIESQLNNLPQDVKTKLFKTKKGLLARLATILGGVTVTTAVTPTKEEKPQTTKKLKRVTYFKYHYNSTVECEICKPFDGMEFLEDDPERPILPSEGFGEKFYNTHPNCKCTYEKIDKVIPVDETPKSEPAQSRAAAASLRDRHDVTDDYLFSLNQEAILAATTLKESIIKQNPSAFPWVTEEAMQQMYKEGKLNSGKYIMIEAGKPQITDHRIEGETLRRIITPDILKKLTYTAIRKGADINHLYPKRNPNSGVVVDSEFNDETETPEFLYFETDEEILNGIRSGFIEAVSINGGPARSYKVINDVGDEVQNPGVQCATGECFRLGEGIILGEQDNIAFTFVVTKPGWRYNGKMIQPTEPGIKSTTINIIE